MHTPLAERREVRIKSRAREREAAGPPLEADATDMPYTCAVWQHTGREEGHEDGGLTDATSIYRRDVMSERPTASTASRARMGTPRSPNIIQIAGTPSA